MVGVIPHLRRQIEGDAESADPLGHQIPIPRVGLCGCSVAGVLPHRPQTPAIHGRLNAASVWELPGQTDNMRVVAEVVRTEEGSLVHATPLIVALTQKNA